MKTKTNLRIWVAGLVMITLPVAAQGPSLSLEGYLMSDQRFRIEKNAPWSWSENRISLKLEKSFQEKAKFKSEFWVRSFGFPFLTKSEQLFNKDMTSPYNFDIREAYIDLFGFLTKNMDIRLGRQVIPWGRGDKLNPTRNLNPLDLEDIWDFGRYQGIEAVKIDYYLGKFSLEGVYVPFFRPATLPVGDYASMFDEGFNLPSGLSMASFTDTLVMPKLTIGQSASTGLKLNGMLFGFDFSLSYVYGRDGLPMVYHNSLTPAGMMGQVDVKSALQFPRSHIFGADLAGSLGSIGVWGEMAVFLPEKEWVMTTDLSALGLPEVETVALKKSPYTKILVGMDYTFKDGSYLNAQFLHGFFHERGAGNLNDYLVMAYDRKMMNDKLKVTPVAGAIMTGNWKDPSANYALIYTPSLSYLPNDNTELTIGVRLIAGKGTSAFARIADRDECFFKLSYHF
jgi:hypothetical protein